MSGMESDKPRPGLWGRYAWVGVFLLALLWHTAGIIAIRHHLPYYTKTHIGQDSHTYQKWASVIAQGDLQSQFLEGPFYYAPLYPYVLATTYALGEGVDFLGSVALGQTLNGLLGLGSVLLAFLIARKLFGQTAGFLAGGLVLLNGSALHLETLLLGETLLGFLSLVFLYVWISWKGNRRARLWLFALGGLALGGMVCLRGSNLLMALGFWSAVLWQARRGGMCQEWRRLVIFGLGFLLLPAMVVCRNGLLFERWTLTTNGPVNIYIGNAPGTFGVFCYPPGYQKGLRQVSEDPRGERAWLSVLADELREQPGALAAAWTRKSFYFFNSFEAADNGCYYFARRYVPWVRYGLLGPLIYYVLGFTGIWMTRHRHKDLLPLYLFAGLFACSIIFVFVSGRFKLPFYHWLSLLAAGGMTEGLAAWKARDRSRLLGGVVILGISCFCFWPQHFMPDHEVKGLLRPTEFVLHGRFLIEQGQDDAGRNLWEEGRSHFPSLPIFSALLADQAVSQ